MVKSEYNYSFSELFQLEEIQKLQDSFSAATGVASIIVSPHGTPITKPSGFTFLCQEIIRKTSQGCLNCMRSDAVIGKPSLEGPRIQRCLSAGLLDGGASIMAGNTHIASWLIGQVLDKDVDRHRMLLYADHICADKDQFMKAMDMVPRMSRKQFESIAAYLYDNTKMLSGMALSNARLKEELKQRKYSEIDLSAEKELFRITINSIGDAIITTDVFGNIVSLNPIAEQLTGWTQDEAVGAHLEDVFQLYQAKGHIKVHNILKKILKPDNFPMPDREFLLQSCDNKEYYISGSGSPIKSSEGRFLGTVTVFRDISDQIHKTAQIEHLSHFDMLTSLYNRSFFEHNISFLQQMEMTPVSIILGDVNGLKISNDVFGHNEGDRLLRQISRILEHSCRQDDIVSRWGGDEFAIILPRTTTEEAYAICERIMKNCEADHECMIPLNIALGVATKDDVSQDLDSIIRIAENRMYRNKILEKQYRTSVVFSTLKNILHEKEGEYEAHCERVSELAVLMGEALGFSSHEHNDLEIAAKLHDIGKVAIADHILNKPGKLTFDERLEINRHSEIGFRIAQSVPEIAHISEYILYHHERWDGNGYPQGRKGENIPLISRIINIADAYTSMTSNSIYKPVRSHEEALIEINSCAGSQFDPSLVDLFIGLMTPMLVKT